MSVNLELIWQFLFIVALMSFVFFEVRFLKSSLKLQVRCLIEHNVSIVYLEKRMFTCGPLWPDAFEDDLLVTDVFCSPHCCVNNRWIRLCQRKRHPYCKNCKLHQQDNELLENTPNKSHYNWLNNVHWDTIEIKSFCLLQYK